MTSSLIATDLLDREFLDIRAQLLQFAAALDRVERAQGSLTDDPRLGQIRQAVATLALAGTADRAREIQMVFSLPFDPEWRVKFAASTPPD